MNICPHCKHYHSEKLKGLIVNEKCKVYFISPVCFPECQKCSGFSRSLKSRLGLVRG